MVLGLRSGTSFMVLLALSSLETFIADLCREYVQVIFSPFSFRNKSEISCEIKILWAK